MAPRPSAPNLASLARGTSSLQLRERALSALGASTSASSASGPNKHCNEQDEHVLHEAELSEGAPTLSEAPVRSAIGAWLGNRGGLGLTSCTSCQPLGSETRLVAQSIFPQTCPAHQPIGTRPFASRGAADIRQTVDAILSEYKRPRDTDAEEVALRTSMAAIKRNLSLPEETALITDLVARETGPVAQETGKVARETDSVVEEIDPVAEVVNKFFTFSEEDMQTRLAEGLPRSLEKEFAMQRDKRILVRRQWFDLFEKVKQRVEDREESQYRALVLTGLKGSGKSALLTLLVHQCRAAGWLALYVPSGKSWISGWFYGKDEKSGFFDTPVQAEKALQAMLDAHGDLLDTLPIRVPLSAIGPVFGGTASVDLDMEELATGTPEEGNLKSLVELGLEDEGERAGEMLARLRVELTRVTEVPVLIAIDEYNCWFGMSEYGEVDEDATRTRRIAATEMRLVHAFGHLDGDLGLQNGVVVAAASESLGVPARQGMPGVHKWVHKKVYRFKREESGAILTNYFACGVMFNASKRPTDETITMGQVLTGGNGHELRYYGPLLQADRPALPTPEVAQPLLEGYTGGFAGDDGQPAPRIRNFVQSLSGKF